MRRILDHSVAFYGSCALLWLNVLDVLVTKDVLERGGTEINPIMRGLVETDWIWLPKVGLPVVLILLIRRMQNPPDWLDSVMVTVVVFYALVVFNNLFGLKGLSLILNV